MDIRPATADEAEPFFRAIGTAFHGGFHADDLAMFRSLFEPERSLAAYEDGRIVGTTGIYTRELTIPGAIMSIAGVTLVGVLPTHRRRGVLTALMRRQLDDVRAAGEPVAALWASEAAIYGRFGYGCAAHHATVTLRTGGARLAPGLPDRAHRPAVRPGAAYAGRPPRPHGGRVAGGHRRPRAPPRRQGAAARR